jgi:hypothetical protein
MSEQENDGFDEIVGRGSEASSKLDFRTLVEAIQQVYPHLYDGILVRSVVILDRVNGDGDRELMWVHQSDAQPWEVLGMVDQVLCDMKAENAFAVENAIMRAINDADEADDDDA